MDDIIEEVRDIRSRISAGFDDDPVRLGAYLMEYQKQFADRLVDPGTWGKGESAA